MFNNFMKPRFSAEQSIPPAQLLACSQTNSCLADIAGILRLAAAREWRFVRSGTLEAEIVR